jgi:hypothetical protein
MISNPLVPYGSAPGLVAGRLLHWALLRKRAAEDFAGAAASAPDLSHNVHARRHEAAAAPEPGEEQHGTGELPVRGLAAKRTRP